MTCKIQLSGLCINCLNSDDCNYRLNHTKPIIFCEEFSCVDPPEPKTRFTRIIKKMDDSMDPQPKGLCSNCENNKTCTLQKKGALVINCEEYK
jgi:hypothetical protein